MSWSALAIELAQTIDVSVDGMGIYKRRTVCVSAGEPDIRCAETVGIYVWVSGIATEADPVVCSVSALPIFVLRVSFCPPNDDCADGASWHNLYERVFCAFAAWKTAKCESGLRVQWDGSSVSRIAEGAVYADLTFRIESGC